MTMDEVNERFPLMKYKNWVTTRAMEGLPTAGCVIAPPSRAASVRDAEGVMPTPPVETKHSVSTRPPTAASEDVNVSAPTNALGGSFGDEMKKSMEANTAETGPSSPTEEHHPLEQVQTTASTVNKHATTTSEDDDDDDEHIHTAVPPELLANPGDTCAICIDTLEEDDDIRGLTCGHAFHAGCLDPWLTSRRACCPLCKADYFTPNPRTEGETSEPDRSGRRAGRMPQPPPSVWTGMRGSPRLMLTGRFMIPPGDAALAFGGGQTRRARRAVRQDAAEVPEVQAGGDGEGATTTNQNSEQAAPRRWRPNISTPFRNIWIPGRSRPESTAAPEEPSPSQLESGTVR